MTLSITNDEFNLLRTLIEDKCGIVLGDEKIYLIESRLMDLVLTNGCETFGELYSKIKNTPGGPGSLLSKVVDAMTTKETLWFRDESPFTILREVLFPEMGEALRMGKKREIRIWSAASSTGQEPYSIAMTLLEYARMNPKDDILQNRTSITATDISPSALMLAKSGKYNGIAMSRGLPPGFQDRYFTAEERVWAIKPEVQKLVNYQNFNLQDSFFSLGKFDIIFLRNVAIYFSADFKKELFKKLAGALNPGGYLFVGSTESLINYSTDFELKEHKRGLYYQVKH